MRKFVVLFFLVFTISTFAEIRTPDYGKNPYINSPSTVALRVNSQLNFKLAVSGERPFLFTVANLPSNFKLDGNSGLLTGKSSVPKDITFTVTVTNKYGKFDKEMTIKVGDKICLTPPMGWNSWYCFNEAVTAADIKKIADGMVNSGLADYGYSYINIDDCWQGERDKKSLALLSNEKFPNMKELVDYIHSKGLKAGLYSSPWICTYAGFRGGSAETADGQYFDSLPEAEREQPNQLYGTYPAVHQKKKDKVGSYWFFDKDAKQFAAWGFDFIKVDWNPNDVPTTKKIFDDLKNSGRDIALSLSNATPYENIDGLKEYANTWRTTGDIRDTWTSISTIAKRQSAWFSKAESGAFNDPDMLQVGTFGGASDYVANFRKTKLTEEEQYFQVSFWSIMQAPLILSCDLNNLDLWTKKLLQNREIIAINQSYPVYAPVEKNMGSYSLITRKYGDTLICAAFNYGNAKNVTLDFTKLYGKNFDRVVDAWREKEIKIENNKIKFNLKKHSAEVFILH